MAEKVFTTVLRQTSKQISKPLSRSVLTQTSEAISEVKQVAVPKHVTELPGPQGLPLVGTLPEYFRKGNAGQMHEVQRRFHQRHGKIFKEKLGPHLNVSIADPELIQELLHKEGKHPVRPPYESWVLYRDMRELSGGLMTSSGKEWQQCRSVISQKILKPKNVGEYIHVMNSVVTSFMDRVDYLLKQKDGKSMDGVTFEFGKWALENTAAVLLDARVGCLENDVEPKVLEFINAISEMFKTGHQLMVFANIHKRFNTQPWKIHVKSWDKIYEVARHYIDKKMDELKKRVDSGEESLNTEERVDFLTYLLANERFPANEVYSNCTEILLSGVDTASNSLMFVLYLLAKHQHVQERLRSEIDDVVQGKICDSEHLQEMPFLKAVIKETLRLYPVIPINARVMTDDVVVDGYSLPKNTCVLFNNYTMSRDERNFEDADSYRPERWLRDGTKTFNPFAAVPFGFGARSCVGRRIAEQKLYLATTRFLQRFNLHVAKDYELHPVLRTVLTPGNDIPFEFVRR